MARRPQQHINTELEELERELAALTLRVAEIRLFEWLKYEIEQTRTVHQLYEYPTSGTECVLGSTVEET